MLQILINHHEIDIPDDISITISLKSPIFNELDGSFAYNFNLPRTPRNNRLIINNPGDKNTRITFNGELLASGIMLVKEIYKKTLSVTCGIDKGSFFNKGKDISIASDIYQYSEEVSFDPNELFDLMKDIVGETDFRSKIYTIFPFENDEYYKDASFQEKTITSDGNEYQQYYNEKIGNIVNYIKWDTRNGHYYSNIHDYTAFNPSFYNTYIIESIISYFGFISGRNLFRENPELSSLVVLYCADKKVNRPYYCDTFTLKPEMYLPDISIADYLKYVCQYFCSFLFVKGDELTILSFNDIYDSINSIDFNDNILSFYEVVIEQKPIGLAELPDDKDGFKKGGHYISEIEDNIVKGVLQNRTDGNINNFAVRPLEDLGIYYITEVDRFYRFSCLQDVFSTEVLNSVFFNYPATDSIDREIIKMNATSVCMSDVYIYPYYDRVIGTKKSELGIYVSGNQVWSIPRMKIKADFINDEGVFQKSEDNTIRLLFYRGIATCEEVWQYPMASSSVYDNQSPQLYPVSGYFPSENVNYSLSLWGSHGRFETWFKKWCYWSQNIRKDFKITKKMTARQINNLSFHQKYNINEHNYLIKSVQVTISKNKINPAEIELARI